MNESARDERNDFVGGWTNFQSAKIATYCADEENCGFYLFICTRIILHW